MLILSPSLIFHSFLGGKISNGGDCKTAPLDEFNKKCFTYAHIYNNLIHDVVDYKKGGTFIYSDEGTCTDKKLS